MMSGASVRPRLQRVTDDGFVFVRSLVIVEGLSSASTEIRRFPNVRRQLHLHSGFVVVTDTVDSSKDFCVRPDGVARFVAQPTTFKAGVIHVVPLLSF